MRLREMIHTLLLGITTLAVAVSCDEKKPENPYPFDGDYTVTQVKTEPSKFAFEGVEVDLQELFLGKALLKLGTIHTIKVEKGKYQLANKEGKTFPSKETQAGELRVSAAGTLSMNISVVPKEIPVGQVSLSGKQLRTELSIPGWYYSFLIAAYKLSGGTEQDPAYRVLKALADANQRVTIHIEATK